MTPDCVTGAPSATVSISELAGWSGLELVARLPDGSIRRRRRRRSPSSFRSPLADSTCLLIPKGRGGKNATVTARSLDYVKAKCRRRSLDR